MLNEKGKRGSTLIALLVVVAVLALAAAGAAYVGFEFRPDASWAEGA
jgi:type II secretory pathway pseudopilin PulG